MSQLDRDAFPASFAQQRLWFMEMLEPGTGRYNIPLAWRLQGSLDVAALERALQELAARHEVLRTSFESGVEFALQVVHPPSAWSLPLLQLPPGEAGVLAEREAMQHEARAGFNLACAPLWRATLCRHEPQHHVLLLTLHHIVADGWSLGVLARELAALYGAFVRGQAPSLPPLPVQYADFAAWQREHLRGEHLAQELAHWRTVLDGAPAQLQLPTDRPRPARPSHRGTSHEFDFGPQLSERLRAFCREHQVTPFMTLAAALGALLARWCRQDDLCLGYPVANRQHPQLAGLVGFFVNTLVLRLRPSPHERFVDLLRRTREAVLTADAHQDLPFDKLVEHLNPDRDLHRSPIFQVLLAVDQAAEEASIVLPGLRSTLSAEDPTLSKFDLSVHVTADAHGWRGALAYDADLFDPESVAALAEAYSHWLRAVVDRPSAPLRELGAPAGLPADDAGREDPRLGLCVHEHVAEAAARHPEGLAVICGEHRLSRRELEDRANRLAHVLREAGVGADDTVGVMMERGPWLVPALLAVLKAGGAYLPLDPDYPPARTAEMLDLARCRVVLGPVSKDSRPWPVGTSFVGIDEAALAAYPTLPTPHPGISPDHLCYVLFTSGSTGVPKAVAVTHRGVVRVTGCADYVEVGPDERVLHAAPLAFDASTFEIWWPLLHGATLVVAPPGLLSFDELAAQIVRYRVTTLWLTAALFDRFVRHQLPSLRGVRQLLAGGDILPVAAVRRVIEAHPDCRIINGYGPTETTTFAACHPVERCDLARARIPIGRPIAHTQVHLLDEGLRPVPDGAVGELYISGPGLARGYLGDAWATAERFVPDPLGAPGSRLYRSGDLARRLRGGLLDFLGRADAQIKVRGFRVEPREIEAALLACPGVHDAAVVAVDDGDGKQLCGVVVPAAGAAADVQAWRASLMERLPAYLVPQRWRLAELLPLTASGKIDRRAVQRLAAAGEPLDPPPRPGSFDASAGAEASRSDTERMLQRHWQEIVPGAAQPDLDRPFFDMGGTSLRLLALHAAVSGSHPGAIAVADLFKYPTLRQLARRLDAKEASRSPSTAQVATAPVSLEF